jgi:phospholipase D1/2
VSVISPETTWRVHDHADSALLIDGRDYYRAFYAAAMTARKSILLLGWQFDSDVELLRGDDLPKGAARESVQLLRLLDQLSHERGLETRILAWNHSVFFAFERELLQKLYFDAIRGGRFYFRWDNTVPLGGSHHQKVAIIDGRIAFIGSQDICQSRWDDSSHRVENEHRTARGTRHAPYHEVQLVLTGEPVRSLVDLFEWRWYGATGEHLDRDALVVAEHVNERAAAPTELGLPVTLPMPTSRIALARTIPEVIGRSHVDEVGKLYVRAVQQAERLIYVESQYLTSCAVRDAFLERMRDASRPKLEIVVVLPHKPERFKEVMTVGVPQARVLDTLEEAARTYGHALGVYNVAVGVDDEGEPIHVYIHAKLMIVDDRVFIVGSANLTNRSMLLDSEIVAAYEARDRAPNSARETQLLRNAIRRVRVRLMLEHVGDVELRALVQPDGLVARLDGVAASGRGRLRKHRLGEDEPGLIQKTVHELAFEFLDPWQDSEEACPPPGRSGASALGVKQTARAR